MELIEKLIKAVNPKAAAMRAYWIMRTQRLYEAAGSSIYHKKPGTQGTPDKAMDSAREKIRDWARHLDENHDLAIGILDELVNKVVGAGINLEPLAASSTGRLNKRLNRDITKLWQRWAKHPEVTGELPLGEVQRLACRAWFRDGEVLAQHVLGNKGRVQHFSNVPYSLEMIEADYLPFDLNETRRNIIHGVEKNQWGKPRAYHLLKQPPDQINFTWRPIKEDDTKRVTADRISHIKFTRRFKQTRGVSVFHGVAHRLDDVKDYEESERIAARIGASFSAYIRKGTDFDPTAAAQAASSRGSDFREMELTSGMIFDDLLPGEEIGTIDTNRPNTALNDYRNSQLKAIAAGTGSSYSAISKNWDGSYSAARQELVESYPSYSRLREYFIGAFLQPMYENFITAAVLSGALNVPRSVDPETLIEAHWIAPPQSWIDPKKEIEADILAIDHGLKTRAQVIRERTGREPEIVKEQIALELNDLTPAQSQQQAQAELEAQAKPPPEPPEQTDETDDETEAA